jgi:MoaA/NifB/PqqE/SkfB family radical SAM enzyme
LNISFDSDTEETLAFFRLIKQKGLGDSDVTIDFGSGERTVNPHRNKMLSELEDLKCCIFTNAALYNDRIGELLSNGRNSLSVSIDAGTRLTFAKIKGVDIFETVCKNLLQYATKGNVIPKYIFLPGVNDNEEDVYGFVALVEKLKAKSVFVSRNFHDMTPFSDHSINMVARMYVEFQRLGMNVSEVANAFSAISEDGRRIQEKLRELGNF